MHEPSAIGRNPPWSGLPLLQPPRSAWPALESTLRRRRRVRLGACAAAAVLAIAALLPASLVPPRTPDPGLATHAAPAVDTGAITALMAESARLEALVAWSREDQVEAASAASLGLALEDRIERIDLLLSGPDADPDAVLPLWQERVLRLRQLAALQSTQQLLAAHGEPEPGQPVLAF